MSDFTRSNCQSIKVTEYARFQNNYFWNNSFIMGENCERFCFKCKRACILISALAFGNCAIFQTKLCAYGFDNTKKNSV